MPELIDADMIRDAVDAAARHLKIAQDMLFLAHNRLDKHAMSCRVNISDLIAQMMEGVATTIADDGNQRGQLVQETRGIGLAGVWTSLALLMALIAVVGFLRRDPDAIYGTLILNYLHMMKSCLCSAYQTLKMMIAPGVKKEHVKKEIKAAMEEFRSVKERLKLMQSQKINKKDVGDIKAAIKTVRSIEDYMTSMKSESISEEVRKQIQDALKPAIVAVQAMEEITNKGVWLL